jgi:predicted phage-related endonuclease
VRLERAISAGLAEDLGWQITDMTGSYVTCPELRLGASFDNLVVCPERGEGIAEIKVVDYIQYKNNWGEQTDTAPDYFELQLQTQLLLKNLQWGCLAPLVGGNDLKVFIRQRDEDICKAIVDKVKWFWDSIANNEEPSPNFLKDYDMISQIYDKRDGGKVIELPELQDKLIRLDEISQQEKSLEAEKNSIKAELLKSSNEAGKVIAGSMEASIIRTKDTPDHTITVEEATAMIGQIKKGRAGHNRITIKRRG